MPKDFFSDWSITISPAPEDRQHLESRGEFRKTLIQKLLSIGKIVLVGPESGSHNTVTHFQIALVTKVDVRQDKLKDKIQLVCKRYFLVTFPTIKVKVHYDINGLIGYCVKENQDDIFIYGLTYKETQQCVTYYQDVRNKKIMQKDKHRVSRKNICECVGTYYSLNI